MRTPGAFRGVKSSRCGESGGPRGSRQGSWEAGLPREARRAAGQDGDALRARAAWRSPKQPSKEGVGGLDSLLGLRHQLDSLTLLPRVVHVASRRHSLLSSRRRAVCAFALSPQARRSAGAMRVACWDL